MKKFAILSAVFASVLAANASWYWPFGSDEDDDKPRLSELMEDASLLIDDATDLAADGKLQDAVAKYREALAELQRVEMDNPDRAATTEFASLRNKRAYVNAAIDTLLLAEARNNAKAVAITDTTELEKKYLKKKGLLPPEKPEKKAPEAKEEKKSAAEAESAKDKPEEPKPAVKKPVKKESAVDEAAKIVAALKKDPKNRKLRLTLIGHYIKASKYDLAKGEIKVLLDANMTDASALNLKAVCEASTGDLKAAEKTLDQVIQSHPRDSNGYYNMANLKLQMGNKDAARRYYETGRAFGGPKDSALEAALDE